jgi:DNA-binding transcriptional regulator YiaG
MGHVHAIVGELIAIRKKWGMSRADLAEILAISEATLMNWELCRCEVGLDKLTKWAGALGYDVKLELRKSR